MKFMTLSSVTLELTTTIRKTVEACQPAQLLQSVKDRIVDSFDAEIAEYQ